MWGVAWLKGGMPSTLSLSDSHEFPTLPTARVAFFPVLSPTSDMGRAIAQRDFM